jgi:hypothetical protein
MGKPINYKNTSFEARLAALEAEVQVLKDTEAIKQLMYIGNRAIDRRDLDEWFSCLAEDCSGDYGQMGRMSNRQEVERFYKEVVTLAPFMHHRMFNPVIQVNGDTATGKWDFEAAGIDARTNKATWTAGASSNVYVREKGRWKMKSWTIHFAYNGAEFEQGWANHWTAPYQWETP